MFGSLLDRQAGYFRLASFWVNHPAARVYEPGPNVLTTTWKTPTGWIVVRDALTLGPREDEDEVTPAYPPACRRRRPSPGPDRPTPGRDGRGRGGV
ncbi:MAG TPA: hypothetical protein VFH02_01640 [Jiangellaceae bacterium]|nr:hypothetical protein [Jiangellaceae bacterium]